MSEIKASMVKELREKTGVGMMDAKSALVETSGDMEAAVDLLRKKGMAKAAKKSSRTAAQGLVVVNVSGANGVVIEVNAETDFVARNEKFQEFVTKLSELALENNLSDAEQLAKTEYADGKTVEETLTELIAIIGENMSLRRLTNLSVDNGVVAQYIHGGLTASLGKIGVLVALESKGDADKLAAFGKQLAMHVAAAFPQYLDKESVDPEALDRERKVQLETAKAEGKPEEIAQKMVEGRMRKYFEEICLLEQTFVIDNETKISTLIENAKEEVGAPVTLKGFVRFQLGEGINVEEEDFAAEVAAVANG